MLQPARRKFRKEQKGRNTGVATRGANVSFGDFGLKATERGRLTARQIEAARRAISRHVKRGGRDLDPHLPGQADLAEAGRSPHGQRQGQPRSTTWLRSSRARCSTKSTASPEELAREAFTAGCRQAAAED